jgi:hypothetical protein
MGTEESSEVAGPEGAIRGAAVLSSALAAPFLIASLMAIAEIADAATPVVGVRSSAWTPLTGAWSIPAGDDAFSGSFSAGPVLLGALLLGLAAFLLGLLVCGAIVFLLGARCTPVAAALAGAVLGVLVQVGVVMAIVSALLGADLSFHALPPWGWWIGVVTWGACLGLLLAGALHAARATDPSFGPPGRPA